MVWGKWDLVLVHACYMHVLLSPMLFENSESNTKIMDGMHYN